MQRALAVLVFSLVFFLSFDSARAQGIRVRAVLANPSAAEETEWIALENTSTATASATGYSLRDTQGSVKSFPLSGNLAAGEIFVLPRTLTGITLNNDRDGVELLKDGSVFQVVPDFTSPGNDQVWIDLAGKWQYVPLAEWLTRYEQRDWSLSGSATPSPTPIPSLLLPEVKLNLTLVSPCTSPEWIEVKSLGAGKVSEIRVEDSSGRILNLQDLEFAENESRRLEWAGAKLSNTGEWIRVVFPTHEELFTYPACQGSLPYRFTQGKWQQTEGNLEAEALEEGGQASDSAEKAVLRSEPSPTIYPGEFFYPRPSLLSTASARKDRPLEPFPEPPLPDFAAEEQIFYDWKKQSLIGSLALVFTGGCFLLLTAPHLVTWYNEHRDPW